MTADAQKPEAPATSNIAARRSRARKKAAGDYEKQRQAIIQAAVESFREMGFEAVRIDDIARRAQLDRASVYYYFKGKKEIFREIIGSATSANVERAETIAGAARPPAEKLRQLIRDLFDIYERHYPVVYLYLQEDLGRLVQDDSKWGRELVALNRRFDAAVLAIVEEGMASGTFRPGPDPAIISKGVVGMCNWSHRWFEPSGKYRAAEIADSFADMVIHGLAQPSAG